MSGAATPSPPRRRRALITAAATALLALFWWLAVSASVEKSQTSDELPHITAGYAYDKFGDFRLQPENGVLPQRIFGLPPLADDARLPEDRTFWERSSTWQIGWDLLYANNNLTDWILLRARALNALFGVALGGLIFAVARRRHGDGGGLVALACYALMPNFLAHAAFATSDMAATFFLTLAPWLFWRHLARGDIWSGLLAAAAGGCALAAKHNGVLLAPMYLALIAADAWAQSDGRSRARRAGRDLALAAAQAAGAVLVLWAFYNFRYALRAPELPDVVAMPRTWDTMLANLGLTADAIRLARDWHLLPEAWLYGFSDVLLGAQERPMFLAGEHGLRGWWQFFPTLFLVKTPLTLLAGLLVALGFSLRRRSGRPAWSELLPLTVSAAVIWIFALTSHLNIGDRHILGLYPVLLIGAGGLARAPGGLWLAGLVVAGQAWESFAVRPHYLASFNLLAGGPARAYRIVNDSSLDWGQDLPTLNQWLAAHRAPGEKLYLGYFGNAWPPHYGVRPDHFLPASNYLVRPGTTRYAYEPGLYCLSATVLNEVYEPFRGPWNPAREALYQELQAQVAAASPRDPRSSAVPAEYELFDQLRLARLCKYLQGRTPEAQAGYSILIFRLTPAELAEALEGPVTGGHPVRVEAAR